MFCHIPLHAVRPGPVASSYSTRGRHPEAEEQVAQLRRNGPGEDVLVLEGEPRTARLYLAPEERRAAPQLRADLGHYQRRQPHVPHPHRGKGVG
ncbi:hypothetical protein PG984_005108 [Apiospora sp. TS-2023a]